MGPVEWQDMTDIVGNFGIGSSDAMIVNLFMSSHFEGIFTADLEMAQGPTSSRRSRDSE